MEDIVVEHFDRFKEPLTFEGTGMCFVPEAKPKKKKDKLSQLLKGKQIKKAKVDKKGWLKITFTDKSQILISGKISFTPNH